MGVRVPLGRGGRSTLCWTAVEVEVEGGVGWCRGGSVGLVGWVGSCEVGKRLAWMGMGAVCHGMRVVIGLSATVGECSS